MTVLAVTSPTATAAMASGAAARAAPAVATVAMANTIKVPMSMSRSVREKCPVGSTLMIGLVENAWYLLNTLAVSRVVKRPWPGS